MLRLAGRTAREYWVLKRQCSQVQSSLSTSWWVYFTWVEISQKLGFLERLVRHFVYLLIYNEMSRLESKKYSPAQVFAQFTSAGENERANEGKLTETKHEGAFENRREIQVTETGEVSLPPDKAKVSIVCSNTKVSDRLFLPFFTHFSLITKYGS